jgi:rubrerythrin
MKKDKNKDNEQYGVWYTSATPKNAHKYECSECGHIQTTMTKQCPNCKTKMKVRH